MKNTQKIGSLKHPVLFNVTKDPIFLEGSSEEIPGRFAIVKEGTSDVIGIVGNKYVPVSNREVLEYFAEIATESGINWEFKGGDLIRGGAKSIMRINFPSNKLEITVGDICGISGNLINGFDGFSSAILDFGFVRLKCTNGMKSFSPEFKLGYRHVGEVNEKIIESFRTSFTRALETGEEYLRKLSKTKLSKDTMISIAEKSTWIGQKYSKMVVDQVPDQIKEFNGKETSWTLYNAFTYVMSHEMKINAENRLFLQGKLNRESLTWDQ